jgi:haloacetate dehalogenase
MFDGFDEVRLDAGEGRSVFARVGGSGPPLLLLHGYPQTHVIWHGVASRLVDSFTVVAADLPGYGASDRPPVRDDHVPHSKRAWGESLRTAMAALGHERFAVSGHDRGGRVAYRLALDHPETVTSAAVLDIVPTAEVYDRADQTMGYAYWHWFFLPQPAPFPETLMGFDPDGFFEGSLMKVTEFEPAALEAYRAAWRDPAAIQAMCEDYRAGLFVDARLDRADRAAGRRIRAPLLALWGRRGLLEHAYDVLAVWREWADHVEGHSVDASHFLAEDEPEQVARALGDFFTAVGRPA